jgi:hypothetical protein
MRAYSMTLNICAMPSCTSPTSTPRASSKVISQVEEALRPILSSTLVTFAPLRSPSEPSSFTQNFGTMNRRQALGARTGALGAGQDEVDDVLGPVEVAVGDEALHAADRPGAVAVVDRLGGPGADVGAGVGLGEDHRPAPLALDPGRTQRSRCSSVTRGSAMAAKNGPAQYISAAGFAPVSMALAAHLQAGRGTEAAEVLGEVERAPAALEVGVEAGVDAGGDGDVAVGVELQLDPVALDEGVGEGAGGEALHLLQHAVGAVHVHLRERPGPEVLRGLEDLEHVEPDVPEVALVVRHGTAPWGSATASYR